MNFGFCREKLAAWLGFCTVSRGCGTSQTWHLYYKGFPVRKEISTTEIIIPTTYGDKTIYLSINHGFGMEVIASTDIFQESLECKYEREKILSIARKQVDMLLFGELRKEAA